MALPRMTVSGSPGDPPGPGSADGDTVTGPSEVVSPSSSTIAACNNTGHLKITQCGCVGVSNRMAANKKSYLIYLHMYVCML